MPQALLEVRDLHTRFRTPEGTVKAVNGASLTLREETILGLVGESGSGKTATALSILRLLPPTGSIEQGVISYKGRDLLGLDQEEMRLIRGKEIALVFQDAQAALNPVLPIGTQVLESLTAHDTLSLHEARAQARQLLQSMGLADPEQVLSRYPFQLSGGMAQRVLLALALALDPSVLIADEPTSNLDVTLQAEILDRLKRFQRDRHSAMLLITHDMGVIARMAQDVAVMYAGTIVEEADTISIFQRPLHPYTWGLFRALPRMHEPDRPLLPMQGQAPDLMDLPDQCPFLPRCPKATSTCRLNLRPPLAEVEPGHAVACYNPIQEPLPVR